MTEAIRTSTAVAAKPGPRRTRWRWLLPVCLLFVAAALIWTIAPEARALKSSPPPVRPASAAAMPVVTMQANGELFALEKTVTPDQLLQGLMYRESLGERRGMLFPFSPAQSVDFWMKNTRMALDMIFIRDGRIVTLHQQVPPCKAEPCPTYPSRVPVDAVVELAGGSIARYRLAIGQTVRFSAPIQNIPPSEASK